MRKKIRIELDADVALALMAMLEGLKKDIDEAGDLGNPMSYGLAEVSQRAILKSILFQLTLEEIEELTKL